MSIENMGEIGIEEADDMNIPVDIHIDQNDEGVWCLTADNYMPRKNYISQGAYDAQSESLEEIQEAVKKYILPLYQVALKLLNKMVEFKEADYKKDECGLGNLPRLYYWEE